MYPITLTIERVQLETAELHCTDEMYMTGIHNVKVFRGLVGVELENMGGSLRICCASLQGRGCKCRGGKCSPALHFPVLLYSEVCGI